MDDYFILLFEAYHADGVHQVLLILTVILSNKSWLLDLYLIQLSDAEDMTFSPIFLCLFNKYYRNCDGEHQDWVMIVIFVQVKPGGGPRVVVSTAAFHARVRGSVPGLGGLKETKMFLPHPRVKVSIVGSLRDREVACSASDRQGSNFESCVWRTVSSQSSHHPQEVLLAQFSLYVHKGGLKPDSFHFISSEAMFTFHAGRLSAL